MYAAMTKDDPKTGAPTGAAAEAGELVRRVAAGRDREALAQLFHAFAPRIKSMMLRLGVESGTADDLAQETLLNVWRKAELYSPEKGAASTWIFTIARNLRIDHIRRQSSRAYVDLESVELPGEPAVGTSSLEQAQVVARVAKAVDSLPEEQREVVRLSFIHELPHSVIAERTGIPLGTVKSRLRLAYDRLRPLLEDLH